MIASPYQLEADDLWTLLEQVGMIEKLGDENISAAYVCTFLSFCQYWGLQAEVVLSWDGFQARVQLSNFKTCSSWIPIMTITGYLSLMTMKEL